MLIWSQHCDFPIVRVGIAGVFPVYLYLSNYLVIMGYGFSFSIVVPGRVGTSIMVRISSFGGGVGTVSVVVSVVTVGVVVCSLSVTDFLSL